MEADELKSDLFALRQLYGLLQSIIGCGVPNITPQNVCESLDKRALQMLKNLLDNATQQKLSEMRIQATTRKPKPYLSPEIIDSSKQLIIHSNIISDQQITNDNNNNYKLEEGDFDSSSTGFSTPTFNDNNNNIDHVVFSNQVSKAIEEIGSNISALHMEENSGTKFFSDQISAPRIPSTTVRATSTDCNTNNTNRPIIIGPTLLGHENWLRSQQLVSEPESSSYDEDDNDDDDDDESEGFYESSSEESSANTPSESSDIDDDEVESSSGINSASYSSSYGTAKSETNPNYHALRRKVQDYSEKAARVSTLRRIKDKLGLIFHHHHHHHHHHNYHNEPRDRWKPLERMLDDHDNKDKRNSNYDRRFEYPNRKNENNAARRRRSMAKRSGTSTNYGARRSGGGGGGAGDLGHFRALVEVLMRHVRGGGDRKRLAAVKMSGGGWRERLGRGRGVRINYNGNYRKRRVRAGFNNRANIQLAKLKL